MKLYGMRFEEYLPHFQLGQALFQSGDCEGALRAFGVSQGQGVVQKSPAFRTLERSRAECQKRAAAERPTPTAAASAAAAAHKAALADLAHADEVGRAVAALETDPALVSAWKREDALAGAQARAAALAGDRAAEAAASDRRAGGRGGRHARPRRRRPSCWRACGPPPPASARRRGADGHARPRRRRPHAGRRAAARDRRAVARGRVLLRGTLPRRGGGHAVVEPDDGPAGTQLLLFRSAARYGLYVTGGQSDDMLRRQALIDATACRRQAPALVPDAEAFSPRFREFFSRAR